MVQMTHRYEMRNGIPQIVIYIYTPLEYEFATDEKTIQYNAKNTVEKIKEYTLKNFPKINDYIAMIIIDGVVIGSLPIKKLKN